MKVISYSGVDGSGKSTQIRLLKEYLDSKDVSYDSVHLFSPGKSVSANLQDKTKGIIDLVKRLKDKPGLRYLNLIARIFNVIIDSNITYYMTRIKEKREIYIFDRYYYDILAIMISDFRFRWLRHLSVLIPKPDLILIMSAQPHRIYARKKEHDIKDLRRFKNIFHQIAESLNIRVLDSSETAEETFRLVKRRMITNGIL